VILIDTTPLVALCDPRDQLHDRACKDLDRLARKRLVLADAVLTEACFLLPRAIQRARLERIVRELAMAPLTVDDQLQFRLDVFAWLARYAEHRPDWADGSLAVASEREKGARVWTYDSEFRTTWRRPAGGRIPLAIR
jgi:predicted nucleic acid-binding protein